MLIMQNLGWHCAFKVLPLLMIAGFSACKKEGASCIDKRGAQSSEVRVMPPFDSIHITGLVKVNLIQDSIEFCEITYGENLLQGIRTEVINGALYISETNRCKWARERSPTPLIEVHFKKLHHLHSRSADSVKFEAQYQGDSLWIEVEDASGSLEANVSLEYLHLLVHTGATDISVHGDATKIYLYNSGYGPLKADALITSTATVHNNNSGHTYVNVSDNLNYQIYHLGNIYLSGNAEVTAWNRSGGGMLFRVNE